MSKEQQKSQPRVMTQTELDADAVAAEEAARKEAEGADQAEVVPPVAEPTPEPVKTDPPAPVAKAEESPELDALKTQIAEKESRIAELTKRVRDEDGHRGGELTALRTQVDRLGDQLRDLMTENRALRQKAPPTPPEEDEFGKQYPDLAAGVDRRTKPISDAAAKAEAEAKEAKAETQKLREEQRGKERNAFLKTVKDAVPKLDEINTDPEFLKWLGERIPGTVFTRQHGLDASSAALDSSAVIELFQSYEQTKTNAAPATPEPSKGPAKPTKEGQVALPKSGGEATPKVKSGPKASRKAELEDKLFRRGTASKEEREELDRLYEAEGKGELT